MGKIRIGTRGSSLARAQARMVENALRSAVRDLSCETVVVKTRGDRVLDTPLSRIGSKGLFTRELEEALFRGDIDIAVHSLKDLPTELPPGLIIGGVLKRGDARDVLLSRDGKTLDELSPEKRIATSSLRRRAQLLHGNPERNVVETRGNVETRIRKMEEGRYEALILAGAGIRRLGMENRITQYLDPDVMIPAVCQGIVGIESREDDGRIAGILSGISDEETFDTARAERAFLRTLQGGCQVPLGCVTSRSLERFLMKGFISDPGGKRYIIDEEEGLPEDSVSMGTRLAARLLDAGGRDILETIRMDSQRG